MDNQNKAFESLCELLKNTSVISVKNNGHEASMTWHNLKKMNMNERYNLVETLCMAEDVETANCAMAAWRYRKIIQMRVNPGQPSAIYVKTAWIYIAKNHQIRVSKSVNNVIGLGIKE